MSAGRCRPPRGTVLYWEINFWVLFSQSILISAVHNSAEDWPWPSPSPDNLFFWFVCSPDFFKNSRPVFDTHKSRLCAPILNTKSYKNVRQTHKSSMHRKNVRDDFGDSRKGFGSSCVRPKTTHRACHTHLIIQIEWIVVIIAMRRSLYLKTEMSPQTPSSLLNLHFKHL